MPGRQLRYAARIAVAFAVCIAVSIAQAQVYKCTDATGKTTYSDAPCITGGKPLALPNVAKGSSTDPQLCAQLQDETRRLASEADRDAKSGRKESTRSAKRRFEVTQQYEARCVGIARSGPRQ